MKDMCKKVSPHLSKILRKQGHRKWTSAVFVSRFFLVSCTIFLFFSCPVSCSFSFTNNFPETRVLHWRQPLFQSPLCSHHIQIWFQLRFMLLLLCLQLHQHWCPPPPPPVFVALVPTVSFNPPPGYGLLCNPLKASNSNSGAKYGTQKEAGEGGADTCTLEGYSVEKTRRLKV